MAETRHPREHVACLECNSQRWEEKRRLPQIGQTYECATCGREVYVYDAGEGGETLRQWRPVARSMATSLLFYGEVGEWPDAALADLFKQGLERAEAIDYRMVEVEGLTQTEWGERTDRDQSTVSENVSKAKSKLA